MQADLHTEASRIAARIARLGPAQRLNVLRRLMQQGMSASSLPIVPFQRDQPLPLSHAQRALWVTWQLAPQSAAYNLAGTLVLSGPLDRHALARAVDDLAERHEVLRTAFPAGADGEPVQSIQPAPLGVMRVEDLSGIPVAARDAEARERTKRNAELAFDLAAGPVWRVLLLRLDEHTHWLSIVAHHIVADGWSVAVLVQDLAALYESRAVGTATRIEPLPIQFSDYAIAQRDWGAAGEFHRQLDFWRRRLGLEHAALPLPLDRPRPAVRNDEGAVHRFALTGEISARLRQIAAANGSTVFMTMLALLATVLARRCGVDDVRVGIPVANRDRAETHGLVGYLTNMLVLRTSVDLRKDFSVLLAAVRERVIEAQVHADCPFDLLVSTLLREREPGVHPLFQVKCTEQQDSSDLLDFHGLKARWLDTESTQAHFDLSLDFCVREKEIACDFTYAVDIFERSTIERLAADLLSVAQRVVTPPNSALATLLPVEDVSIVAGESLQIGAEDDVLARWERHVAAAADAPALQYEDSVLTRGQVDQAANSLAARLLAHGVTTDVRVGIHASRSFEFVVGLLAVLKAGGAFVPMDTALPPERLAYQARDCGVAVLLSNETPTWQMAVPVLPISLSGDTTSLHRRPVNPAQAAYIIYTSGSTGRPKGVVIGRGALANYVRGVLARLQLPDDVTNMAMVSTVAADLGHTVLFGALCAGRLLHLISAERAFDPDRLADYMDRHRVAVMKIVPSHLQALLSAAEPQRVLPLHTLILGGEATHWALLDRIHSLRPTVRVLNHYGPTETTVGVLTHDARESLRAAGTLPLGGPLPNSAIYVLDASLRPIPVGTEGELYLGGAGVALGYEHRMGQTAERFVASPFGDGERLYRTGDRVRLLADRSVEFLGRMDDQVKIRGHRVELGEVAQVLRAQPGVHQAEVIARGADDGRLTLLGYVVPAADIELDSVAIRERIGALLPDYMVPASLITLQALPLNANGKIDRSALPLPAVAADATAEGPQGEVERTLGAIWAEVLGVERVGRHDNFFALGGDSILILKMVARARKQGMIVAPRAVFEHRTLANLAATITRPSNTHSATIAAIDAVRRAGPLPLSHAQARLWFLWQLDPSSTAYHICSALRLKGRLRREALRASFDTLVQRHESLRTVFRLRDDGQAEQLVNSHGEPHWVDIDVTATPAPEREARLALDIARFTQTPFDLTTGPLLRVGLLQLSEDDHVLMMSLHHIVSDGWSMEIMVDEFVAEYRGRVLVTPASLPPLPMQYADYAVWQRQWLAAGERDRQLMYWKEQLGTRHPVLQLPADHPRRADGRYRAKVYEFDLPADVVHAINQLAHSRGTTSFVGLLAGFQVLLHRYCGLGDIRVGVPFANRHRAETQGIVGLFVDTQVLRGRVLEGARLAEVFEQAQAAVQGAQAHQDLPFEQLVEALQVQRAAGVHPLFQVMLNYQRARGRSLEQLPGLSVMAYELPEQAAQFELTLACTQADDGRVRASFVYAAELFERCTIERMAGHYVAVLRALAEEPEQTVGAVELLSGTEQAELRGWGENRETYPDALLLHRWIEQQVEARPQATALIFGEQKLSYAELNRRANRLAHRLIAAGVRAESKVGVALERSVEMVIGLLAILKAGGAYVPLDPRYPAERLAYLAQDSGIEWLLTQRELQGQLPKQLGANASLQVVMLDGLTRDDEQASSTRDDEQGSRHDDLQAGSTRDNEQGARHDDEQAGNTRDDEQGDRQNDEQGSMQDEHSSGEFDENPRVPVHADQLAYVIYTSGSTGAPKGVMVRHGALSYFLQSMQSLLQVNAEDTLLAVTSLSFDIAALELYLPLISGAQLVLASREVTRDGEALGELIEACGATVLQSTPAGWRMLLAGGWKPQRRLKALCGGEALQPDLAGELAALGLELWNLYGPTETTIWSTANRVQAEPNIGGPIAATQLLVLDAGLNRVPINVPGELYLGGIGLARGYLQRAGLTARRFIADPLSNDGARLYRTGDVVRWSPQGRLEYLGRVDHQVKIRGFRIELGEIEAQLLAQPQVREAVVVAKAARVIGYVVGPAPLEVTALRERLAQVLPDYMVPSALVVLDQLPLNSNGKVDRAALPDPEQAAERAYEPPQNDLEHTLAAIWADVLGLERVGRHDDFFELGGHSLLAVQFASRASRNLGRVIPLRWIFEHPVLHRLAEIIQREGRAPASRSVFSLVASSSTRPPMSYAQQRLWFLWKLNSGGATFNLSSALRLTGDLDEGAWRAACRYVVARHAVLRTVFREEDGAGWQCILPDAAVDTSLTDLTSISENREEHLQVLVRREIRVPFDLAQGPLLRIQLIRLGETTHLMLVVMHHIVADGWSLRLMIRDFAETYAALVLGKTPELPPLPVEYADYAVSQRQWLQGGELQRQLSYWQTALANMPPLELPADNVPPRERAYQCAIATCPMDHETTGKVRACARKHAATPFAVLLAAFSVAMLERTGREKFLIGTDMANRNHEHIEDVVGFFVNQVALPVDCAAQSFTVLLGRLSRTVADATDHEDLPFDRLVEAVRSDRRNGRAPLFRVKVLYQEETGPDVALPGLRIDDYPMVPAELELDLIVNFLATEEGMTLVVKYDPELYQAHTIQSMSREILAVLRAGLSEPTVSIDALRAVAAGARRDGQAAQARERAQKLAALRAPLRTRSTSVTP